MGEGGGVEAYAQFCTFNMHKCFRITPSLLGNTFKPFCGMLL